MSLARKIFRKVLTELAMQVTCEAGERVGKAIGRRLAATIDQVEVRARPVEEESK